MQAQFEPNEKHHVEDKEAMFTYFGCLPRKYAFRFQKRFPAHAFHLYSAATATYQLLSFHANPDSQPKTRPTDKVDWDELLDPHSFRDIFPLDNPKRLLSQVSPNPEMPNLWVPRLAFILQCTRQVNLLISLFEAFFKDIGYEGLREVVDSVGLNTNADYFHNMLLETDEVVYFTALYDFLLREHAINLAQIILRLIHVPFRHPYQLGVCRDHIVNAIEPPTYSHLIREYM